MCLCDLYYCQPLLFNSKRLNYMNKNIKTMLWIAVALLGAFAVAGIALNRGESINALWLITAAGGWNTFHPAYEIKKQPKCWW